jgi:nitroreductase
LVRERRATPHFDSTEVPEKDLRTILEAGQHAPSGYNLQPWRFLVLRDPDRKAALRRAAFDQAKITEASVVIVAYGVPEDWKARSKAVFEEAARRGAIPADKAEESRQKALGFIEKLPPEVWINRHTMIAFTHVMLAAEALGWDTAPMEGFDAAAVRKELKLPASAEVVALLAIGRLAGKDRPFPGRLALSGFAQIDTIDRPFPD